MSSGYMVKVVRIFGGVLFQNKNTISDIRNRDFEHPWMSMSHLELESPPSGRWKKVPGRSKPGGMYRLFIFHAVGSAMRKPCSFKSVKFRIRRRKPGIEPCRQTNTFQPLLRLRMALCSVGHAGEKSFDNPRLGAAPGTGGKPPQPTQNYELLLWAEFFTYSTLCCAMKTGPRIFTCLARLSSCFVPTSPLGSAFFPLLTWQKVLCTPGLR